MKIVKSLTRRTSNWVARLESKTPDIFEKERLEIERYFGPDVDMPAIRSVMKKYDLTPPLLITVGEAFGILISVIAVFGLFAMLALRLVI